MSNGGSWRISTTSNSVSSTRRTSPAVTWSPFTALDGDVAAAGEHPAVLHRQRLGQVDEQRVPARLGGLHHQKVVSPSMLIPSMGSIWTATFNGMRIAPRLSPTDIVAAGGERQRISGCGPRPGLQVARPDALQDQARALHLHDRVGAVLAHLEGDARIQLHAVALGGREVEHRCRSRVGESC
jgi:hypothetical protein